MKKTTLTREAFANLLKHKVLNYDDFKRKKTLLNQEDGLIYKIYRAYSKLPFKKNPGRRSRRFIKNAQRLQKLGFSVPSIQNWFYYPPEKLYIVAYKTIEGETFKDHYHQHPSKLLLKNIAALIYNLHQKNIYFRAGHIQNYLYHQEKFYLIDIDNLRFYHNLNLRRRAKNLAYFCRHNYDAGHYFFTFEEMQTICQYYLAHCKKTRVLRRWLNHYMGDIVRF